MSDQATYAQRMIQAQAKEVADRATAQIMRVADVDWTVAHNAARAAVAEALDCVLQDAAFYAENAVAVYRLRRLKEQLHPGATSSEVSS